MANYTREPDAQTVHNIEVVRLAKKYEEEGYDVYADVPLPGYEKPAQINGHIPDIIAIKNQQQSSGEFAVVGVVIVEVETDDSKNSQHARQQERAFSGYANRPKPYPVEFEVVIAR